ncbi:MAG: hypothetical protein WBP64_14370, partial [Nitrososphaeraceae archaeon]
VGLDHIVLLLALPFNINNIDNVVVILTYISDKVHINTNDRVLKLPSVGDMLRFRPSYWTRPMLYLPCIRQ